LSTDPKERIVLTYVELSEGISISGKNTYDIGLDN